MIGLRLQSDVFRPGDSPFEPAFWQSNFRGGIGLTVLMLLSIVTRPEIQKPLQRRLHGSVTALAVPIVLVQDNTGDRALQAHRKDLSVDHSICRGSLTISARRSLLES